MADDPTLNRLIEHLDASFDASLARQEDEAASDLALSLLQGRTLRESLRTGCFSVWLEGGGRAPVTELGTDHVASGDMLVPLSRAVLTRERGAPPSIRDQGLIEVLRRWAREGARVELAAGSQLWTGRLGRVGVDHVEIWGAARVLVAMGAVEWVRRAPGGPADDL